MWIPHLYRAVYYYMLHVIWTFAEWVPSGFYEITVSGISLLRVASIFYPKVSVFIIRFIFCINLIGLVTLNLRGWLVATFWKRIIFYFVFWNWIGHIALNLRRWLILTWTLRKKKSTCIIYTRVCIRNTKIALSQKLIITNFQSIHNLIKKNKVINTFFSNILN